MADLISREAALEWFTHKEEELCQRIEAKSCKALPIRPRFAEGIASALNSLPAVDAVEVVRCEDCKYWKSYGGSMKYYGECEGTSKTEMWGEDDFCSHGERREENAAD